MRSAILVSLLLGCGAGAMAMPLPLPAEDVSLNISAAIDRGNFGTPSETMQGFTFNEADAGFIETPAVFAGVAANKPWIRGPEPPAAVLTASGFAFIALSKLRRRRSAARPRFRRRRVYTVRQMA